MLKYFDEQYKSLYFSYNNNKSRERWWNSCFRSFLGFGWTRKKLKLQFYSWKQDNETKFLIQNALCEISTWYLFNRISGKKMLFTFLVKGSLISSLMYSFPCKQKKNKNEIFYISTTYEERKKIYLSIHKVSYVRTSLLTQ